MKLTVSKDMNNILCHFSLFSLFRKI